MSTVIGIVIGIAATIIVSRYYFKRSINKSIAVYLTLNSRIFAGIEPSVREQLKFYFSDAEVRDVSQIEFIIANDGERALRDFIQPLSVELPAGVEILDASILYRKPEQLIAEVEQTRSAAGRAELSFRFPLLNQGDFFLVKLLLNGRLKYPDLEFHILADDLPRVIQPKPLPPRSTTASKHIEWSGIVVGAIFVILGLSQAYAMYLLYRATPQSFPVPWQTFTPDALTLVVLVFWSIGIIGTSLVGLIILFAGIGFEEFYRRHPRFPLPSELRHRDAVFVGSAEEFEVIQHTLSDKDGEKVTKARES